MHLLHGFVQVVCLFPLSSRPQCDRRVQRWARGMLQRLGVRLEIAGIPVATGPMLLVSNHVSWLDIVVLHAICHCRFVAKSDVERWPLIGTMASGAGTLYVERRSRRDAMRVVEQIAQTLKRGETVAIFPQGTTGDGQSMLPFHANLIEAAITAEAPVQTVAIRYLDRRSNRISEAVSYMGDESLAGSIWRTLLARGILAVATFGPPQSALGRDRHAWARDLQGEVAAMLDG